ncbi:DUF1127 domain-containing protein [Pseudomonas sp. R2.Fl]|nr:DUF1127 domain-containing protein [Pseudomonas sp. R2.Fl]
MKADATKNMARTITHDEVLARIARVDTATLPERMKAVLFLWLGRFVERRRYRRELSSFPDSVLKDFGLDRKTAHAIAHTPFWRAEPGEGKGAKKAALRRRR